MTLRHCITRLTFSSNDSPATRRFPAEPSRSSARCTEYLRMISDSTATASTIDRRLVSLRFEIDEKKGSDDVGEAQRERRTSTESSPRTRSMTGREAEESISRPFISRLLDVDESFRPEIVAILSPILCCSPDMSVKSVQQ